MLLDPLRCCLSCQVPPEEASRWIAENPVVGWLVGWLVGRSVGRSVGVLVLWLSSSCLF